MWVQVDPEQSFLVPQGHDGCAPGYSCGMLSVKLCQPDLAILPSYFINTNLDFAVSHFVDIVYIPNHLTLGKVPSTMSAPNPISWSLRGEMRFSGEEEILSQGCSINFCLSFQLTDLYRIWTHDCCINSSYYWFCFSREPWLIHLESLPPLSTPWHCYRRVLTPDFVL